MSPSAAPTERPLVDERVTADRALLAALVRGEDDLDFHGWQLTDPGCRLRVDDLAEYPGRDLTRRPNPRSRRSAVTQ